MPAYLLSTQALADAIRNSDTAVNRWAVAEDLAEDEVVASAVSFTVIKRGIELLAPAERAIWRRVLTAKIKLFHDCQAIRPISVDIAVRAADLDTADMKTTVHGRTVPVGDLGLLVVATALEEQLTLVEQRQPYHAKLESEHRLAVFDPYGLRLDLRPPGVIIGPHKP